MPIIHRRAVPVLLCAVVALTACHEPAPARSTPVSIPPATRFTVLPVTEAPRVLRSCSPTPGGDELDVRGAWVPDTPLVARVEERLPMLLDSVLPIMARANGLQHVPAGTEYLRQYMGFELDGQRMVYVHGLHETLLRAFGPGAGDALPWQTKLIGVCDAGSSVFGVFYDPASGTFGRLEFSGSFNGPVRY